MASSNTTVRIRIISACIMLLAAIFIIRLFSLQVIHGDSYAERADRQYATPAGDIFERGSIFFKDKENTLVPAATMVQGYKIAIDPEKIKDAADAYAKLTKIVLINQALFMADAAKKTDPYEEVAFKLTKDQADAVSTLDIPGVSIFEEKWRFYPGGTLASNAIGFVAYKGDSLGGRYGLERYYDDVLSRKENGASVNFFAEVFSNITDTLFKSTTKEGDIVTTIDPQVQHMLEDQLQLTMDKWHSDNVGGIVINPKDGSIYAMAVQPNFDLNAFSQVTNPLEFADPNVENVYEFGSVIKALTMAAGIDDGAVTAKTTYNDKGYVVLDKAKINNYDFKGRGVVPMQEVLNQSLNTGVVYVMQQMGKEKFKKYMLGYGIGEKTGIDLPGEISGLVDNLNSPREVEYATAAFGQGIALTPIEATRALSVLANGGVLVTPHVVSGIEYADGTTKTIPYPLGAQVLKPATSAEISRMLTVVVDKALLGGTVKMDHYSIAAKTGTAQMAREDGKGYYDDRYLHSFFGYFPAYDPKFLIFLYNINPKGVDYASHTLTDPFINMSKFLISYYDVPPDR
jgi:stage V sporulation protein D (sporulation-specific penicillin-binding protein)